MSATKADEKYSEACNILKEIQMILYEMKGCLPSGKEGKLGISATQLFVNEIIDLIDAASTLFINKKIAAGMIIIRSIYEISLQLMYLLFDNELIDKKASYLYFINIVKIKDANLVLYDQRKMVGAEYIPNYDLDEEMEKEINQINNQEHRDIFKSIFDDIKPLSTYKWALTSWFKIYSEKTNDKHEDKIISNNEILCLKVNACDERNGEKITLNKIVYNLLSKQAHGANVIVDDANHNLNWLLHLVLKLASMLIERINYVYPISEIEELRKQIEELKNKIDSNFQ